MKNETVKKEVVTGLDSLNLQSAKINLKNSKVQEILEKEGKEPRPYSNKNIYLGLEKMGTEEQKKFRGKIRRDLKRYVSQILGKDKSEIEKTNAVVEFLEFYKKHWRITDFKIENFSSSRNESDLRDYKNLLNVIKLSME